MSETLLAVPPRAIAQVVQVASDPECSTVKLSEILKKDPVLSAQILKAVNSAYYSLPNAISSVDHAVSYMGIRSTRNLVLCMGVRHMAPSGIDFPLEAFWGDSLRRGASAQCLGKMLNLPHADELFTLGLCQDLGVLVLLKNDPEIAAELGPVLSKPSDYRLEIERARGKCHDETGADLFEQWRFPQELIIPIRHHHNPDETPEPYGREARIAYTADLLTDLFNAEDMISALMAVNAQVEALGIEEGNLDQLLMQVADIVHEAGEMLNIKVEHQPTYQEIAEKASGALLEINQDYEENTVVLESANKELQRMAMIDELTGLPNRRSFDESLDNEIARVQRNGKSFSLMMLDIDHFKKVNDDYGHQTGDCVLRAIAAVIRETARECDVPARYGGEEFAVILSETSFDGAKIAAERYRSAVEKMTVDCGEHTLKVTVSIGVAEVNNPDASRAGVKLIRAADDALYEAKDAGRNCVVSG